MNGGGAEGSSWAEPPSLWPELACADAQVWCARLTDWRGRHAELAATLAEEERARAGKFIAPLHRERFEITRGLLRRLLGGHARMAAREVQFACGPHGKPELAALPAGGPLHFNLSHSGDLAVFAFTRAGRVGVDIERIREDMPRKREIAARYFAPGEGEALAALPEAEERRAFFECWARKEAFVKARGDGVFGGLQRFEVSVTGPARLRGVEGDWWIAALPGLDGCAGAVVVEAGRVELKCWRLAADGKSPP